MIAIDSTNWTSGSVGFTPTILLGRLPEVHRLRVMEALIREGWDVRTVAAAATDRPEDEQNAALVSAAEGIRPDIIVTSGSSEDPWGRSAIVALRSNPATHDSALMVWTDVSLPQGMEVTPMSGPDGWVFPETPPEEALRQILRAAAAALDGHLEWAQRDWTDVDRRRNGVKSLRLRIEQGRMLEAAGMAALLFGRQSALDIRIWDLPSPHLPGWRYGAEDRYAASLLAQHDLVEVTEAGLSDQVLTLHSRSGQLLIAALHAAAQLAGGWPTVEALEAE